jgi:hypothetical protein
MPGLSYSGGRSDHYDNYYNNESPVFVMLRGAKHLSVGKGGDDEILRGVHP